MTHFLIDTNIWLQELLGRSEAMSVRRFLTAIPSEQVHTSVFAIHSVGVVLSRHKLISLYTPFIRNVILTGGAQVVSVPTLDLPKVEETGRTLSLDFDDAYQYTAAEINNFRVVSLDADFDRTPRGRLTPEAALKLFTEEKNQ